MKKAIVPFLILLGMTFNVNAQGNKDIMRNDVKTQTVHEYFLAEGMKDPVIERVQVYDTLGNVVEKKEFNKEGEIKSWLKFEFDANGDAIVEEILDEKGRVIERQEIDFKNGLIREKRYFDKKGRLIKKKEYKYEFN